MLDSTLDSYVCELLASIPGQTLTKDQVLKMSLEDAIALLNRIQGECENFGIALKSPKHTELQDLIVLLECVSGYYFINFNVIFFYFNYE